MPLVGEPDIAAGHPAALERGEHAQALGVGHAEVEGAVDHQGRRLEVGDEAAGRPLAIMLGLLPGRTAKLPFGEPELLGRAVLARQVEDARRG